MNGCKQRLTQNERLNTRPSKKGVVAVDVSALPRGKYSSLKVNGRMKNHGNNPRVAIHTSIRGSPNGYGGGGNFANGFQQPAVNLNKENRKKGQRKHRTLRLATWNIQGWRTKGNEVTKIFNNMDLDILVTSETKKKGNGIESIGNNLHIWSGVNKEQRAQAGVGILIKNKLKKNIRSWEPINERIIKINLTLHGRKIVILGAYGPTEDAPISEKSRFIDTLQYEIAEIKQTEELFLAGDLNGRVGKRQNDDTVGRYGEEVINNNGENIIEMCELYNLKITNGFYQHNDIHKYTWIQPTRGLRSIIDYLIIKKDTSVRVKDIRVQRGAECGSDHRLLLAKIDFPWTGKRPNITLEETGNRIEKEKKLKIHLLKDESIRNLYQNRLDQKLVEFRFHENVDETYEHIKQSIKEAGKEALGEAEEEHKDNREDLPEDILVQIENKKYLYHKWLSSKTEADYKTYRQKDREVKRLVCTEKNKTWQQTCSGIDQHIGGTRSSEAWKIIKSLRTNRKEKANLAFIQNKQWERHYKELLIENRKDFMIKNGKEDRANTNEEQMKITQEEIRRAIVSTKNGKAAGPGGIVSELIKYGTEKLWRMLRRLFEKVLNGEEMPMEWQEAQVTSIFKKGERNKCENYRGISVLSTIGRIYGRIIKIKLEENIKGKIGEEQAGFTAGRSGLDHIYTLQQLIEKKKAKNRDVHLAFIDLRKAYDTVPRNKLWETMVRLEVPGGLIRAVKNMYKNNTVHIKSGSQIVTSFRTSKGLLQGCPTSPTLFKIFLEDTLRPWKRKCHQMGINIRNEYLYTLCFADDQVVIAQDEEDLNYMIRKLQEVYQNAGLEINFNKTEYLATAQELKNLEIEANLEIKGTDKFKYLGFTISRDTSTEKEINSRLGQTRTAIRQLHPVISNKNITKKTKKMIYETIVQSIMTYAAEIWVINKKNKGKILATEMEYWRRCCGLTRLDKVRNEEIRRRMGVEKDTIEYIEQKRLIWYGHVRRAESRWINKITEWSPIGRRKRGRPRRSWRDEVDESMERRGLEDGDWESRQQWGTLLREGRRQ